MSDFTSKAWFEQLAERANAHPDFQNAARWFKGTVGWKVDDQQMDFHIANGQITSITPASGKALCCMAGSRAAWDELKAQGTINRLFRQGKIDIQGDKVEAMRFWKILWYLTEIGRKV